jgi:hypothetical protein
MSTVLAPAAYLLPVASMLALVSGCLETPSKDGCITSVDCLAPNLCVDNHCVANLDAGDSSDAGALPDGDAGSATSGYVTVEFDQESTRLFTDDGDWAPGELVGQCPADMFVNGISVTPSSHNPLLLAHSALCEQAATPIDHANEHIHGNPGGGDDRGDTSTGDWDVGFTKLECGPAEVVIGVAQSPSLVFGTILCSRSMSAPDPSNCVVLPFFHDRDDRLSSDLGDWAIDYSKNECGSSYVLRGMSIDFTTGELHRVLCCARMMPP